MTNDDTIKAGLRAITESMQPAELTDEEASKVLEQRAVSKFAKEFKKRFENAPSLSSINFKFCDSWLYDTFSDLLEEWKTKEEYDIIYSDNEKLREAVLNVLLCPQSSSLPEHAIGSLQAVRGKVPDNNYTLVKTQDLNELEQKFSDFLASIGVLKK